MRHASIRILLILLIAGSAASLRAAPASGETEQLAAIMRAMVIERNSDFIIVAAIKDGFIKESEEYTILYKQEEITINGKLVPPPFGDRYLKLIRQVNGDRSGNSTGSYQGGGVSIKDITDPRSGFWDSDRRSQKEDHITFLSIIGDMAEDHIIEQSSDVTINCNRQGVFVNCHMLSTPLEAVYKQQIMRLSGMETDENVKEFSMTIRK